MEASQSQFTALDLFCGCGGCTLGLKLAGFQVLGAVDNDSPSIKAYHINHPDVKTWETDIRKLDPLEVAAEIGISKGTLDLLAGCPPCQGFSTMRTLNGSLRVDDPRNHLLLDFQRFAKALTPKTIMIENVPGLSQGAIFHSFCKHMVELGYIGDVAVFDTSKFGVPQRRRRLIYLAGLGTKIPFGTPSDKVSTVRDSIGELPKAGQSGDPLHDMPENRSQNVISRIQKIPKNGGSRTDLPQQEQLECHKKCNGFKDVYGRMKWDAVAPTITSGCFNPSKGRFLHPDEDRAITMREASLLQTFPINYQFPSKSKILIAAMIGNALPPEFVKRHALSIRDTLIAMDRRIPHES